MSGRMWGTWAMPPPPSHPEAVPMHGATASPQQHPGMHAYPSRAARWGPPPSLRAGAPCLCAVGDPALTVSLSSCCLVVAYLMGIARHH